MAVSSKTTARRQDIDLLRAIAVLSVIFFHFEIPGFGGGFLGVDIFFVISGYLITLHIQEQMVESRFSFAYFYMRRIRRLFPALIATLVLTSIAAVVFLPKSLLSDFSNSQLASSIYISNIYFWSIADYFDTESIVKPLLHTWSLSVEEQFYLIWPLFLLLAIRHKSKLLILGVGALSLIAAEYAYSYAPSTVFFHFPFRIFEFAIGALVSGVSFTFLNNKQRNMLFIVSIVSVAATLLLAKEQSRNPGLLTLPLCFGTATIICLAHPWANHANSVTRIFLRIGLVSYSAYLVHWPLVVFYKIENPGVLSISAILSLLVATYVLAEFFYNFVERPALRIHINKHRLLILSLVPLIFILAVGFNIVYPHLYKHLNPQEYTAAYVLDKIPDRRLLLEEVKEKIRTQEAASKHKKTRKIIVIGDSHSVDVTLSLQLLYSGTSTEVSNLHSICDPLVMQSIMTSLDELYEDHPQDIIRAPDYCTNYHATFLDNLKARGPDLVIFSESWRKSALPFLKDSVQRIKKITGADVLILGHNPIFAPHPNVIFKNLERVEQIDQVAWERHYKVPDSFDQPLTDIAEQTSSYFISKNEIVCPNKRCILVIGSELGYVDSNHWSLPGMNYYGKRLIEHKVFTTIMTK